MKKSQGWQREPARHALSAKGVSTGRTSKRPKIAARSLVLMPSARKSGVAGISDSLKEECADKILMHALKEAGGDEENARGLIGDEEWLSRTVRSVVSETGEGLLKRGSLQQELLATFRKGAVEPSGE